MIRDKFLRISQEISEKLSKIITHWDGKKSILEMKNSDYNYWKQMEWIGFYFQFLCQKILKNLLIFPGPKYGNVEFDAFKEFPWDFKSHAINTSAHQIIVNDSKATTLAISEFKCVGLVLALGEVKYNDKNRTFQKWHEELKGGLSKYTINRINRGAWSRLRKVEFHLKQISFIMIDDNVLVKCGSFQRDFRNANGSPRNEKVLLDLEKLDKEIVHILNF